MGTRGARHWLIEGAVVFGAFAFFAAHLHEVLDISLTAAGAIIMLFCLGGFLFAIASRQLVTRLVKWSSRAGRLHHVSVLVQRGAGAECMIGCLACFTMGLGFYMLQTRFKPTPHRWRPNAAARRYRHLRSATFLVSRLA